MNLQNISNLLDKKLEPLTSSTPNVENNINFIKTHIQSMNKKLIKLEQRVNRIDSKLETVVSNKVY